MELLPGLLVDDCMPKRPILELTAGSLGRSRREVRSAPMVESLND